MFSQMGIVFAITGALLPCLSQHRLCKGCGNDKRGNCTAVVVKIRPNLQDCLFCGFFPAHRDFTVSSLR